jgi:thiol peroxidase
MATERYGAVTYKGTPQTVIGSPLKVGDKFPDVTLVAADLSPVDLQSFAGKVRLFSVVPSLDSGICNAQTRRFNEEAQKTPQVKFITVSADLPWGQRRWVNEAEVKDVTVLSDHRDMAFGDATGTHVKELRVDQRSIFVVAEDGTLRYVEYVPEIAQHPDYDAALDAAKKLIA